MSRSVLAVLASLIALIAVPVAAHGASITGNPETDGWAYGGHSLENGVYVRGSANYGFDVYSATMVIEAGSNLVINDGASSWLVGDTVLGLGGSFAGISPQDADWLAFTGNGVNALLGEDTKLVGKFGTDLATFSASTVAPGSGNGTGSTAAGGAGTVFVRTSGWFYAADWAAGSGLLMELDKTDHVSREGNSRPSTDVARLMWQWDPVAGHVSSWEILLNVSLLDRLQPGATGLTPGPGNSAILSVQRRDGVYTDALVRMEEPGIAPVPEPATMGLLGLSLAGLAIRGIRRKRTA